MRDQVDRDVSGDNRVGQDIVEFLGDLARFHYADLRSKQRRSAIDKCSRCTIAGRVVQCAPSCLLSIKTRRAPPA